MIEAGRFTRYSLPWNANPAARFHEKMAIFGPARSPALTRRSNEPRAERPRMHARKPYDVLRRTRRGASNAALFLIALFRKWTSVRNAVSSEGAHVNSSLKIQTPDEITLIEKIKAELKKRAELKAKRMLLKVPKRRAKH